MVDFPFMLRLSKHSEPIRQIANWSSLLFPRQDFIQQLHRRIEIFGIRIVGVEIAHLVAALLVGRDVILEHVHPARLSRIARHGDRL